ncbi:MAG: gliding motility protein GldN [Phycisphaerales bacterium]|nr:gliding motility protein GldN [Phycisphaerales bacterium]
MNVLKSYKLATILFLSCSVAATAQTMTDKASTVSFDAVNNVWKPSVRPDGSYDKVAHISKAMPWQPLREDDIMWKKRVWREIDVRQKQNMPFIYPGDENTGGGSFIEILIDAVKKGKVMAYSTLDERFTTPITKEQIMDVLVGKPDTVYIDDIETGEKIMKVTRTDFNPNDINKFRIKEDVIFDRNLGRKVTRIIGLAPLLDKKSSSGEYIGTAPFFWLYYPDCRDMLAQYEVFNPENDVARMTWDDYFEGRFFASYIYKISNPFDARFKDLGMNEMDILNEGQRVSEDLMNKEHDMWVY